MVSLSLKCDLQNMLRQARAAIDPKRDRHGSSSAGIEQVIEHLEQVRQGTATPEEFCEFYLITTRPDGEGKSHDQ